MIQRERLLETFLELVRIPSPSGAEAQLATRLTDRLQVLGLEVEPDAEGNLLARLDGEGEALLLNAHMDTVRPCKQVTPVVCDGVVFSDGTSVLGADDKAGIAVILEVLAVLQERRLPHHPLEVLLTVREEVGLEGAKAFDLSRLRAKMGIGLDAGGEQGTIIRHGPSQNGLRAQVIGRAAHAAHPERGINAIRVAAEAIAAMPLGRIDEETTANLGVISGGTATNIVPECVRLRGEARSRDEAKLQAQTEAMIQALERAARAHGAKVELQVKRSYTGYRIPEDAPIIQRICRAMQSVGIEPHLTATGGGADANVFNADGLQVVQISAGMEDVHAVTEHVALANLVTAAQIVLACVRG